ncbi:MAG: mannosyl-3-phosphoglycerate phosphatase-related protein [Prochlorococcus sp. SP3034]|nr:mannosyl-3-phosphoglycerate phosphatase-related protein [Prochlorococcus sp. SP3034]|tara:strand:+ start:486 stop:1298 length:813 start_codon:yes stop_codon:yes gene_type:complete
MIESSQIWIVSDVDGTLMDHSYDLTPALETIKSLQDLKIPVILCTSKTAAEVEMIRNELNLTDPYIVENGAAIYGENKKKKKWEIILGQSYQSLETILNNLSIDANYNLIPLNKLTDHEAYELTGMSGNSLILMRDRHWSMPFLNPPKDVENKLKLLCSKYKVNIFKGNRMSHLLSIKSNKGKAIKKLIDFSKNSEVEIIGLGDSPNDLPLLVNSNYKIIIPGPKGPNQALLKELGNLNYIVAKKPHGYGWSEEVSKLIKNLKNDIELKI